MYNSHHKTNLRHTAHKFKQAYALVSKCTTEVVHYSSKLPGKYRIKITAPPLMPKNDKEKSQCTESRLLQ